MESADQTTDIADDGVKRRPAVGFSPTIYLLSPDGCLDAEWRQSGQLHRVPYAQIVCRTPVSYTRIGEDRSPLRFLDVSHV